MPEYIKALIVILGLSFPVFWIARTQVSTAAIDENDFDRRRNLWIGLTVSSFLSQSFWVYAGISCVMVSYAARKEKNALAFFLFVAFAVPAIIVTIPGFAGIQHFFSLSHTRVLVILILFPAYLKLRSYSDEITFGKTWTDKFVLAYIIYPLILQLNVDTITNTIRFAFYSIIDTFLPYYVASRGVKTLASWKDVSGSMTIAIVLLAVVAVFEHVRGWLLYGSLPSLWGADWNLGVYMLRSESLRSLGTAGHAIVLGYILMVGMAFYMSSKDLFPNKYLKTLIVGTIALGLYGSAARGPWVGSAVIILVLLLTGEKKLVRFIQLVIGIAVTVFLLSMTKWGMNFIDYLPFIGSAETESVSYRQRLFDISIQVIQLNPFFGSFDFMRNPLMQQMIQGEGIIDLVNSYIGISLTYGLIGLSLFLGIFLCSGYRVWRAMINSQKHGDFYNIGRSLIAVLAGVLVTIATVGSMPQVALIYWIVAGLCTGYGRLEGSNLIEARERLANVDILNAVARPSRVKA